MPRRGWAIEGPLPLGAELPVAPRSKFGGKGPRLAVRKIQHAMLVGFVFFLVAAFYLGAPPRQSAGAKNASVSGAHQSGSGVQASSSIGSIGLPRNPGPSGTSQPTFARVIAGGAGAGKSAPPKSPQTPNAPGAPVEVLEAAQTGLPFFLDQIPPGSKELYGFSANDDLSLARLGDGLRMHAIKPTTLMKASSNVNVSSIVSDTSMWFFPVLIESDSKAMLVVDRDGDSWKAVSFGYAALGHELNHLLQQWPVAKGFRAQLIAVFQAKQFYFTVPEIDDLNLTPITLAQGGSSNSAVPAGNHYAQLGRVAETLQELRPVVARAEMLQSR